MFFKSSKQENLGGPVWSVGGDGRNDFVQSNGVWDVHSSPESLPLMQGHRSKLRGKVVCVAVLAPWVLFCGVFWVTSFWLRFYHPRICCTILVFLGLATLFLGALRPKLKRDGKPNWMGFCFTTACLALVTGVLAGELNYRSYMQTPYETESTIAFKDVYPNRIVSGNEIPRFGGIKFAVGARIDVSRSMGIKNGPVYCVSPIVMEGEPMPSYEFWAVGIDCCTESRNDFHCKGFDDPQILGGLPLLDDDTKPKFEQAVQRAKSVHNLDVRHAVFVDWEKNAAAKLEALKSEGLKFFLMAAATHGVMQSILVILQLLRLKKTGRM